MKKQILLVEDEALVSELLSTALGRSGFAVTSAGTAGDAIDLCNERVFDLILLDLGLPDGGGMETLASLRAIVPDTPVIILTGHGEDEALAKEAKELGAAGYFSKASPLPRIIQEVGRVLPSE